MKLLKRSSPNTQNKNRGLNLELLEDRLMLSTVQIFASGTQGGEQFELQINESVVQTFEIGSSNTNQVFTFETAQTITADDVRIEFTNDFFDASTGADSNLIVDAIAIDGTRFETEADNVFSTGTFLDADGIQPGFRNSETLHTNGFFQYAGGGNVGGSQVDVVARGFEGDEQFNLILDGQVVSTFTTSTSFQTFSFNAGSNVELSDVSIEFFGDQFNAAQGIDTNLEVDFITIDGQRFDTEDPSTFSTGTFLEADGIVPGFRQSQILHTSGFFNFGAQNTGGGGGGDNSSQVLQFDALGTTGQEIVELVVRGEVVETFALDSAGVTETFSFTTGDSDLSIEDIRIEFVNDLFDAATGTDRNAQIFEFRLIDNATGNVEVANTNDSNVLSDGIFVDGIGLTSGFGAGGFLATNGFVQVINQTNSSNALEILGVADGAFDGIVQGQSVDSVNNGGNVGAVVLTIIDGNQNVQSSNFGGNSFQLTNTGNKEIAAVFIDIRDAVFGDMVFDNDGTGGDTTASLFQVDSGTNTGGFFVGENNQSLNAENLFFAGDDPLADTSGLGSEISGGFRGLLIRFDGSNGGFDGGEVVGFSGDGDPNSLAGFSQGEVGFGSQGGGNAITGTFDTGGQSGAELVGSSFTVLFADGTTASGFIGSDTTQAGGVGEAVQGREQRTPNLTVDTGSGVFSSTGNSNGQYGGTEPQITVTGQPGDTVRVTLYKGVNPVVTSAGSPDSVADVIQNRLNASQSQFPVNNAFDVQNVDVVIGSNGTAQIASGAFDYNNTISGVNFAGDQVQPLAITAAIVVQATDGNAIAGGSTASLVPLGSVSTPVYLLNSTATPVA